MDTQSDRLAAPKQHQSSDRLLNRPFQSQGVQVQQPKLPGVLDSSGIKVERVFASTPDTAVEKKLGDYDNTPRQGHKPRRQLGNSFNLLNGLVEANIPRLKPWKVSTENNSIMAQIKRYSSITTLVVSFSLGLALNVPAQAQLQSQSSSLSRSLPDSWGYTPPERGNPDGREQGATRGNGGCMVNNGNNFVGNNSKQLTALIPKRSGDGSVGVGLTSADYPSFFWYMPPTTAKEVEFVLKEKDEDGKEVYKNRFAIKGTPGILSLQLPASADVPPLRQDEQYYWEVNVICNAKDREQDIAVWGWIKRVAVDPELSNKLQQASLQERVALYAKANFWYETLETLMDLRRLRPNDRNLEYAWEKLLKSADLDPVAKEPLTQGAASPN